MKLQAGALCPHSLTLHLHLGELRTYTEFRGYLLVRPSIKRHLLHGTEWDEQFA